MINVLKPFLFLLATDSGSLESVAIDIPKNRISIGIHHLHFFDGNRGSWSTKSAEYYGLIGSFGINYQRALKNNQYFEVGIYPYLRNRYHLDRGYNQINQSKKGDVLSREMGVVYVRYGNQYRIIQNKKSGIFLKTGGDMMYRFGTGDHVFLGAYPGGFDFASTMVKSNGIGLGGNLGVFYLFKKHWECALDATLSYVFEKGTYEETAPPYSSYYLYKIPRFMFNVGVKVGVRF